MDHLDHPHMVDLDHLVHLNLDHLDQDHLDHLAPHPPCSMKKKHRGMKEKEKKKRTIS